MSIPDRALYILITGFGTGLAPVASGTFGTLPAVVVGAVLQIWWQGQDLAWILGGLSLIFLLIGCSTSKFVLRVFKSKDPKPFVLDEIVGYFIALGMIAAVVEGGPSPTAHALCFFFFRLFDVLKPAPARQLEALPGAYGIMMDDVFAGIYAGLVVIGLAWAGIF